MNINSLTYEIHRSKQFVNIPKMIDVIKKLNNKLATCRNGMEKLQTFIKAADLLN